VCLSCLSVYLALATALWGYYGYYRKIPDVSWADVVVLPRFSRVQAAIGAHYFSEAKRLWDNKNYAQAIFTARAAVVKSPRNLDARLFLAGCWQEVFRFDEAVRTLRDGIEFSAADARLQKAIVGTCLACGRFGDLLEMLRKDLPAKGVRLLEGREPVYRLAELRAVLETAGPAEAERVAAHYSGIDELPAAAPLLALIDWDSGRREAAFTRLQVARDREPNDPSIQDAYVDTALRIGKSDEARAASQSFLAAFPDLESAQLRFLEAHGSRQGPDKAPWMDACTRFLVRFRHRPEALGRLASLASSQGWPDLAYLLYQNSLQDNLTGFPFAVYYVGSLVKAGDFREAESVWHDLSLRNSQQLVSASYLGAMVAWGTGHESEALQITQQLQQETAKDPTRRLRLVEIFNLFGFPKIADELGRPQS